jgi:hypothetical protein
MQRRIAARALYHFGPLVRALLAEDRQQHDPGLAGKEERDSLRHPSEVEPQLEQSLAERPGVWHPQPSAPVRQTINVEGCGGEFGWRQVLQPRPYLRF